MNMKHGEHVDAQLNAFDEHQEERGQEEVVQQHRHHRAQLLYTNQHVPVPTARADNGSVGHGSVPVTH